MIAEILKIKHGFKKVQYYTLHIEGRANAEYLDFLMRMKANAAYHSQLAMIEQYIRDIGEKHGAHPSHFRNERYAEALPPPYFIQPLEPNRYGIRLYCIWLSTEIVLLLSGDLKTKQNPEKCPNCQSHFRFANAAAQKIKKALDEGYIRLNRKELDIEGDFELIL